MDPIAQSIKDFVLLTGTDIVSFITTISSKGAPVTRQVSTFVEDGWITGTVSQPSALKLKHIPGNPKIS